MSKDIERDQQLIEKRFAEAGIEWPGDPYDLDKKALARAAPLLLQLLDEVNSPITKDDIVRVVCRAKVSSEPFLKMLRELRPAIEAGDGKAAFLGWTLGEALRIRAAASVFDDLAEIVEDTRFGTARQMVVYALARVRSRREDAIRSLLRVLFDEDLILQTLDALGKLRAAEAVKPIQRHLDSPKRHIRTAAKKALAKIAPDLTKGPSPPKPRRKRLGPIPADFVEASTNFDLNDVPPFLGRLSRLVDGFGSTEREEVEQQLDTMESDQETELEFPVGFRGEEFRLRFKLYICDEGAVDLAVFTVPTLSQAVEAAMEDPGG